MGGMGSTGAPTYQPQQPQGMPSIIDTPERTQAFNQAMQSNPALQDLFRQQMQTRSQLANIYDRAAQQQNMRPDAMADPNNIGGGMWQFTDPNTTRAIPTMAGRAAMLRGQYMPTGTNPNMAGTGNAMMGNKQYGLTSGGWLDPGMMPRRR